MESVIVGAGPAPAPTGIRAYIGLGSNLGDRKGTIMSAIEQLTLTSNIHVVAVSSFIETKPVGPVQDQPDFLNAVAAVDTTLSPLELLDHLLSIETRLGRVREMRWGPRTIDLDLLIYGSQSITHPRLQVPHPEIANRPFVQTGLREVGVGR